MIPAHEWNRQIDEIRRHPPLTFSPENGTPRLHPWTLTPAYDAERKNWTVEVEPGFVNGDEVEARISAETAPVETLERLGVKSGGNTEDVRAWLTEAPQIPLSDTRLIGEGSDATGASQNAGGGFTTSHEPVPEFFLALGVRAAKPVTFSETGGVQSITGLLDGEKAEEGQPPRRLLRACDVVLSVSRVGIASNWRNTVLGMQFEVQYIIPPLGAGRASVGVSPRYTPPHPDTLKEQMNSGYVAPGNDELHVGTVFLLSPENAAPEDKPDGTWQAFTQHQVTWNLAHRGNDLTVIATQNAQFVLPLAGGVGQPIIDFLLGSVNTGNNQAAVALARLNPTGRFWTA